MEKNYFHNDKYNPDKIEKLHDNLVALEQSGKPRDYDITIDSSKVIPRTNDTKLFESFQDFIEDDTKLVVIKFYFGNSKRYESYAFYLGADTKTQAQQLAGFDEYKKLEDKLNTELMKRDKIDLQKQINEKDAKIQQAEDYIEILHSEIDKSKDKKFNLGNINIGELSSVILEGIFKRNIRTIEKYTGMNGLSNIIEEEQKNIGSNQEKSNDTNASFSKDNGEPTVEYFDPQTNQFVAFMNEMLQLLEQEQLDDFLLILNFMKANPNQISNIKAFTEK